MAFEIVKTFVVRSTPEQVWSFLTDPEKVARCLPGAAITGKLDDKTWQGTMTRQGRARLLQLQGQGRLREARRRGAHAEIVATGQDVRGRGGADLRLTSTLLQKAPGETEVTTTSRVNITGILAQMGRGMVQDVGDQMFQVFSQRVRAELETAPAAAPAQPHAPPRRAPAAAPPPPPRSPRRSTSARWARAPHCSAPVFWVGVVLIAGLLYLLFR